jgi:serine/threonine-protein kinase
MTVPLEQFVEHLEDSGILSGDTLRDFLPPKAAPKDGVELARELVRNKKLTKFQAETVCRGKGKSLVLGNYVILDRIGAGGMGQVFKAEHRRMRRLVAVKMLPTGMMKNPADVARFEREVTAVASLSHPNIVTAFDADNVNGVHLLVMEYVEGNDLSALVKKNGPFSVEQAVNCILQAARGLEAAHAQGVVHRDIKPANLLLDKKGTVKILDMGLARIRDVGSCQTELTNSGKLMGTVDYMAPEQAVNSKSADAPADIYSLGYSLYYLLAGTMAYDGVTLVEKLLAHRDQPIPSIRAIRPEVPQQLEAVFRKMVAKRIDDRYRTMSEVIAELEQLTNGQQPPGSMQQSSGSFTDAGLSNIQHELSRPFAPPTTHRQAVSANGWIKTNKMRLLICGGVLGALILSAGIVISSTTMQGVGKNGFSSTSKDIEIEPDNKKSISTKLLPIVKRVEELPDLEVFELFNGRDLTGWIVNGDPANWEIDAAKGVLTATGNGGQGWLFIDHDVGDFLLDLEYQTQPGANSGIAILASPEDTDHFEVQVSDIANFPTGGVWSQPTNRVNRGFTLPTQSCQLNAPGEWNSLKLELRARKLGIFVNGVEVLRLGLDKLAQRPFAFPPLKRTTGRIGLECQTNVVRYRNIRLSEITASSGS